MSLLITDDREIQELNAQYRGKDAPTDVLSFSLQEGEDGEIAGSALGDIVISLETAERQAKEVSESVREELIRLLIHGLCHLQGYDHENVSEEEAEKMRERELEMLSSLDI